MGWTGYHGGFSLVVIVVAVLVPSFYVHARTRYPANRDVFGYRPFAARNKLRLELPYMRDVAPLGGQFDSHRYYYGDEYQSRRPVRKYRRHKTRRRYYPDRSKYDNYNYDNDNDDYNVYDDDVDRREKRPHRYHRYQEDDYDFDPGYGKQRKKYRRPLDDDGDEDDGDEDRETERDEQDDRNKDDEDDADNDADYDDSEDDNDEDDEGVAFHSTKNDSNAVKCKYGNVILYVLSSGKRWSCGKPSKGSADDSEQTRSAIVLPGLRQEARSSDITKRKRKGTTNYFKMHEQSKLAKPAGLKGDIATSSHIKILQPVKFITDVT